MRWTQQQYDDYQRKHAAARNQTRGMASGPKPEPIVQHESVAKKKGKGSDSTRHLVRVTSFRLQLLDERNLTDKYFNDALIYAGAICGDSPKEVQVIVNQELVLTAALERTEIIITAIP